MLKISKESIEEFEHRYPGIAEQIAAIESRSLPPCFRCGSDDTAAVNVGVIGRTILLASASTKFHLRASDEPGEFYCNTCKQYF